MKVGVHKDLSYDAYAALPAVRSSQLVHFRRSAAHARVAMTEDTETAAKVLGQALHVALLEPDLFEDNYVTMPKLDRRTNVGKTRWAEFEADNAGKIPITAAEMRECRNLAAAAHGHPIASALLAAPGLNEVSLVWQEDGFYGKARLDRLTTYEGFSTIVDVKTTRDARPFRFNSDAERYGYHVQAAWYLRGADALAPVARRYILIALEKDEPNAVAIYELDETFLQHGRDDVERALVAYKNATESGVWPGYPNRISTLYAPGWMRSTEDEETE